MKKIAVVFCVFFSFATVAWSQAPGRTITNDDLEPFAQQREAADREYRETYAAKGMLSPDDLKARNAERVKATIDLANQLTAADLERQRLALEATAQQLQAEQMAYQNAYPAYGPDGGLIWGYGNGFVGNRRFDRRFRGNGFWSRSICRRRHGLAGTARSAASNASAARISQWRRRPQALIEVGF